MKSKLFLTVLLLAVITTIGISQDKQATPKTNKNTWAEAERLIEEERIRKLPVKIRNLVGVKGIYVAVEMLNENAKSAGLTEKQLKTDVELKLRLAGIKVNSEEEWKASKDGAFIYVNINSTEVYEIDHMIYSATIKLNQDVMLVRAPYTRVPGTTWEESYTGIYPKSKFQEQARKTVKDYVDEFINDYLTANPKK